MLSGLIRNTFPALLIVWTWFLTEVILSDVTAGDDPGNYFLTRLKVFCIYTALGIIAGGLSGSILARKKKKYSYFFENGVKEYLKYFYKNFLFSLLILFVLLSRELINQPGLFRSSLLDPSFIFSNGFNFLKENFSPLYFTVFFLVIIIMGIHNLSKNLSIYQGFKRISGYITVIVLSFLLLFNFGYLNAENNDPANVILIGVEGLERADMQGKKQKGNPSLSRIKSTSYDFENFYSVSKKPRVSLLSILTSKHPEKNGFFNGRKTYLLEKRSIFKHFRDKGYTTAYFSDRKFAFMDFEKKNRHFVKYPEEEQEKRSEIYHDHNFLPVIVNNRFLINFFRDIFLLDGYSDRTWVNYNIENIIREKSSPFFITYIINKEKTFPYPYYRVRKARQREIFVNYIDDEIGKILESLDDSGRYGNTLICLFGIPENRDTMNSSAYRVPFYMSLKEFGSYRTVKNNYSTLDVFPTVADRCGLSTDEENTDGSSFFKPEFIRQNILLSEYGGHFSETDNIYIKKQLYPKISRSVIRGDYKLDIVSGPQKISYRLYDIKTDFEEEDDLVDKKARIVRRMRSIYSDIMKNEIGASELNGFYLR